MKVAVISNSHLASLKQGYDLLRHANLTPVFFGAGKNFMMGTRLSHDQRRIEPVSIEAKRGMWSTARAEYIEIGAFDAYIVYGLTAKVQLAFDQYRSFQPFRYRSDPSTRLISEPAFRRAIESAAAGTSAAHILGLLKSIDKPVLFASAPRPAETIIEQANFEWLGTGQGRKAYAFMSEICDVEFRKLAGRYGAMYVTQPANTLTADGLTLNEYNQGAVRSSGTTYVDVHHMNASMGAAMLDSFQSALSRRLP